MRGCPMQDHLRPHQGDLFGVSAWLNTAQRRGTAKVLSNRMAQFGGEAPSLSPTPLLLASSITACPKTDAPPKVAVARHRRAWYKIGVSEVTTWSRTPKLALPLRRKRRSHCAASLGVGAATSALRSALSSSSYFLATI